MKEESNILYMKTLQNKQMDITEFFKQQKHFFIMTDGGTPIYSRYGDELQNSDILATFSAIITKFTVFNASENNVEKLNYISNDKCSIVFLQKRKIIFIALSKKNDSISFLNSQLECLWYQLLSIITSQRLIHLKEKPSSFISALQGTEELFEQMIQYTSSSIVSLISCYHVFPIEHRTRLNQLCSMYIGDALMCCLFTYDVSKVIAISKSNLISIMYSDILLIQNKLMQDTQLHLKELWIPICLPGISEEGYLQMYSNFYTNNKIGIVFITECQENDFYMKLCEQCKKLIEHIEQKGLMNIIETSLEYEYERNDINNNEQYENNNNAEGFIKQLLIEHNVMNNKDNCNTIKKSKTNKCSSSLRTNSFLVGNSNEHDIHDDSMLCASMVNFSSRRIYSVYEQDIMTKSLVNVYKFKGGKSDPFKKILYCVCKHKKYNQFFSVNFNMYRNVTEKEKMVYKKYAKLYDFYCSHGKELIDVDNFYHVEKDSNFTHVIYSYGENYLLMVTMSLFILSSEIFEICKEIFKLIKAYEMNFFINIK